MEIPQKILTRMRFLLSPEAPWRLPSKDYLSALNDISLLCAIPLYHISENDRLLLAKFYSSFSRSGAFILLRITLLCTLLADGDAGKSLTSKVTKRLFGKVGEKILLDSYAEFSKTNPTELKIIENDVSKLLSTAINGDNSILEISNFHAAADCGVTIKQLHPNFDTSDKNQSAYIGAHWIYCGQVFHENYENWLYNTKMQEATARILNDFLK